MDYTGPTSFNMDVQVLQLLVQELKSIIGSKDDVEAKIAARYRNRIAELEQENKRLIEHANNALLIHKAVAALDSGPADTTSGEDPDLSPILEQRVLNLQTTLDRVRQRASRKEEELTSNIKKLEWLAMQNIERMMAAVARNVEQPILPEGTRANVDDGSAKKPRVD